MESDNMTRLRNALEGGLTRLNLSPAYASALVAEAQKELCGVSVYFPSLKHSNGPAVRAAILAAGGVPARDVARRLGCTKRHVEQVRNKAREARTTKGGR